VIVYVQKWSEPSTDIQQGTAIRGSMASKKRPRWPNIRLSIPVSKKLHARGLTIGGTADVLFVNIFHALKTPVHAYLVRAWVEV